MRGSAVHISSRNFSSLRGCARTQRTLTHLRAFEVPVAAVSRFFSSVIENAKVVSFILADVGEGIAECEILRWHVREGDYVKQFQPICEVQSDKATVEITSRFEGTVRKLRYEPGDMAKVGSPLLDIETAASSEVSTAPASVSDSSRNKAEIIDRGAALHEDGYRIETTPAVRALAKTLGVSLSDIVGTGTQGRITKADVEAKAKELEYATQKMAGNSENLLVEGGEEGLASKNRSTEKVGSKNRTAIDGPKIEPIRGLRRTMIKTMSAALSIPHFFFGDEYNVTSLMRVRSELGGYFPFVAFFVKCVSLALSNFPIINSSINASLTEIIYHQNHNIGIAVDTKAGLVVPVIKAVESMSVYELREEVIRLAQLARDGKLQASDISDATITVSNIGAIGGTSAAPLITTPQVAIGAFSGFRMLPRYDSAGKLEPQHVMMVNWAADHRVIDGATLARFSNEVKNDIENPAKVLFPLY